jgi:hypothetical protein
MRLDDHLVQPEITRDEIIGGQRAAALPASPPHALQHARLDYVICANVVQGYRAATHLLTRYDQDSDFASDTCVVKDGLDPETETRYLEEMAFLVVSGGSVRKVWEKALRMHRRGVRRVFAVLAEACTVCEWCADAQDWRTLPPDFLIEEACLVMPVPVSALLNPTAADNAVARALLIKGHPVLRQELAAARNAGAAKAARALSVVAILETRGLSVTETQRQRILSCTDLDQLSRWLRRAVLAASADDVTAEP